MIRRLWQRVRARFVAPPVGVFSAADPRDCGLADAVQSGWFNQDSGELYSGFRIERDNTVLDFGCGEGGATMYVARQGAEVIFADSELEKIDALEARVRTTAARAWRGVHCQTDLLPLADGSVDKVIAMEVLEHVRDPQLTLSELVRVAAPGAQFLLAVPDPAAEALQKHIAPAAHFMAPNHVRVFQRDEFDQLVKDAGLAIEKKDYSGFYWSLWMCFYWVCQRADNAPNSGATLDKIAPPYHPLLERWAATWLTFIGMPESAELKAVLDKFLPKSQIIIARKPL
jgi:2-polyprenyl-3-methyl-5-hydroxy-6-metoxy-1,4-benzoquinol methylase